MELNAQATDNIERFFKKRSVEFGNIPRYNDIPMWPFWMPFIPEPPQDTDQFPPVLTQALTALGWRVPAGGMLDIPIVLEQDAIYHYVNHKITAYRGPATGEITALANNVNVTGVGTLFTTEFQVGDTIAVTDDSGQFRFGVIASITNALALVLHAPFGPNAVTGAAATGLPAEFRIGNQWYEDLPLLPGGIQVAGVNVTGIGTSFNTDLQVGQNLAYVDDTGVHRVGTIATIPGALALTFTAATGGGAVAGASGVAYKLAGMPHLTHNKIRPLTTYLRVSLLTKSNNSNYLLGGNAELAGANVYGPPSLGAAAGGLQERPHAVNSIQGFKDGLGSLYTPYQLPNEGTVFFRVHNTHSLYTLYVNGTVFGYKVSI